ncbi:hypothetical protein TNCV_4280131 [Trichonephila clavipes]|nr:hypothetical protein TNCV_4280131 [Trichonephila clavipes]
MATDSTLIIRAKSGLLSWCAGIVVKEPVVDIVTSSRGVNSHLPIHNRFYGLTSWSRTRTTPIDCPWIVVNDQLGSDQCTWPGGHCLLSELREWRRQTGRHNGLRRPTDNRQSVSQNNHVIFSRVL